MTTYTFQNCTTEIKKGILTLTAVSACLTGCMAEGPLSYLSVNEALPNTSWGSACIPVLVENAKNDAVLSEQHDINFHAKGKGNKGRLSITTRTYSSDNCSGQAAQVTLVGEYKLPKDYDGSDPLNADSIELSIQSLYQPGLTLEGALSDEGDKDKDPIPTHFTVWGAETTGITSIGKHAITTRLACPAPKTSLSLQLGTDEQGQVRLERAASPLGLFSNLFTDVLKPSVAACLEAEAPNQNQEEPAPEANDNDDPFSIVLGDTPYETPNGDEYGDDNDYDYGGGGFGSILFDIGAGQIEQIENALLDGLFNLGGDYRRAQLHEDVALTEYLEKMSDAHQMQYRALVPR